VVKNIYTAFLITQLFLLGAGFISFTKDFMLPYILFFFLILTGSVLSDLRDYEGDKRVGHNTLPVKLGYENGKKLSYILLVICGTISLMIPNPLFYLSLPFLLLTAIFLRVNRPHLAHKYGSSSFLFLALWLGLS